ncbi:MAG: hypothetical protein HUJ95_04740 [Bacteroidales bacterium]|nr:hypothetical protein [Bacteroidales bacterium]
MKLIYRNIFGTAVLMLSLLAFFSCAKDEALKGDNNENEGYTLVVTTRKVETKAVQPTAPEEDGNTALNENKISRIDAFIIDPDGVVKYYQNYSDITAQSEHTVALNAKPTDFDLTKLHSIYVIVNYSGNVDLSGIQNLTALRNLDINLGADFNPNSLQDEFVMDGHIDDQTLAMAGETYEVHVKRAAAKIRIHVSYSSDPTVRPAVSETNPYLAKMNCYVNNANLLADGTRVTVDRMNRQSQTNFYTNLPGLEENCSFTVSGSTAVSDFIFYSYPNDWNVENSNESYISLMVPLWEGEGEAATIVENYYKIPVNWRLPVDNDEDDHIDPSYLYRLDRNHIYEVEVYVDALGSKDPDEPKELYWTYHILDWTESDRTVDVHVYDIQWLWVKDDVLEMDNVSTITTTFDASLLGPNHVVTIDSVRVVEKNKGWWAQTYDGTGVYPGYSGDISVTLENTTKGTITIESPIPDRYVGKEFWISIKNTQSNPELVQRIHVYQYPAINLTQRADPDGADAGEGQTNANVYMYTVLLSDIQNLPDYNVYPDEYDLEETTMSHGETITVRRTRAAQTSLLLKENAKIGYPLTETNTFTTPKTYLCLPGNTFAWYYIFDPPGYSTSTTLSGSTRITSITAQTTIETEENNWLISPKFILASQRGANSISTYSGAANESNNAKQNCASYWEKVNEIQPDGTVLEVLYPSGTWRVPTRAEMMMLDVMQNLKKALVKKVLEGGCYFNAANPLGTSYYYIMMDPRTKQSSPTAVRCVHDIK